MSTRTAFDLGAVDFLGSAGLCALIDSSQALAQAVPASMLHLSGVAHRAVRRPLKIVGVLQLFTVHVTLDDALSEIAADSAGPRAAGG